MTSTTLEAADSVIHDLLIAVFLVAFVMLFFLHSIRNSLIVMVSIPASLISTFIGFYYLGYTLNLMSLLGLSLVVGILVDDAIVVLENIYRHMEMEKIGCVQRMTEQPKWNQPLLIVLSYSSDCDEYGISFNIITVLCYGNYLHFILLTGVIYDNPWLSSRFGKTKLKIAYSWVRKILTRFTIGLPIY
jgi:HAE1 family hydrophobic/amphiphilic exporter-1